MRAAPRAEVHREGRVACRVTTRRAPGVERRRARGRRGGARRRSKTPRSTSRSVVGGGDIARRRRRTTVSSTARVELRVPGGATGLPTPCRPSRSSSGRTSGSAYDIASSRSPNRGQRVGGPSRGDRHVAVVVAAPVWARIRVAAGRERALVARTQVVAVDHARGVDLARDERPRRVALAADVVAVQPDADVEAAHARRRGRARGPRARRWQRDQRGLRASRPRPSRRVRPACSADATVGLSARTTTTDVRSRSVSRIVSACDRSPAAPAEAHRCAPRRAASSTPRRCGPADEVLDLALVVRVQDVVEVEVLLREPAPEAVPDRDDLRVVRDRAHHQRRRRRHRRTSPRSGRPVSARPTKSCSASVVGAITPGGAGVAEPALDAELLAERRAAAHLHRQVGDVDGRLAAAAFTSSDAQRRVLAARSPSAASVSPRNACGAVGRRSASARASRAGLGLLGQRLVEVLEPRRGEVRDRSRRSPPA